MDFQAFGLEEWQLNVTCIAPKPAGEGGKVLDMIGVVTALEGEPLPANAIASRLGGFNDVSELEGKAGVTDFELISLILGSKNDQHIMPHLPHSNSAGDATRPTT